MAAKYRRRVGFSQQVVGPVRRVAAIVQEMAAAADKQVNEVRGQLYMLDCAFEALVKVTGVDEIKLKATIDELASKRAEAAKAKEQPAEAEGPAKEVA